MAAIDHRRRCGHRIRQICWWHLRDAVRRPKRRARGRHLPDGCCRRDRRAGAGRCARTRRRRRRRAGRWGPSRCGVSTGRQSHDRHGHQYAGANVARAHDLVPFLLRSDRRRYMTCGGFVVLPGAGKSASAPPPPTSLARPHATFNHSPTTNARRRRSPRFPAVTPPQLANGAIAPCPVAAGSRTDRRRPPEVTRIPSAP